MVRFLTCILTPMASMLRLGNANTSICATLALYIFRPRKGQAMRLNRDIRYQIYALLVAGHKQKAIAKQIGISEGGLSKEISRNGGCRKYDPEKADKRAVKLQHKAHVHYKYGDDVWNEVEGSVMEDWSPDEIVGRRTNDGLIPQVSLQSTAVSKAWTNSSRTSDMAARNIVDGVRSRTGEAPLQGKYPSTCDLR